jgi:hypothetical protein
MDRFQRRRIEDGMHVAGARGMHAVTDVADRLLDRERSQQTLDADPLFQLGRPL